jgi:uncharacterized protein YdeI (BOF family)
MFGVDIDVWNWKKKKIETTEKKIELTGEVDLDIH